MFGENEMSDSLLFGYSVEENGGKFVITLAGTLAVPIMQDIAANIGPGGTGAPGLPTMFPYSLLASHAVRMAAQAGSQADEQEDATLADIFGQGFDKDLGEFDRQVGRYRELLSATVAVGPGLEVPFTKGEASDAARPKRAEIKT